jgi:adenylate cyclase
MLRKVTVAAGIAAASIVTALLLSRIPIFTTFEWKIYDLQFRRLANRPAEASSDIVMVGIDDLSVQRMAESGFGRFPWARDTYGVLLDYFARNPPKVVAFDILFLEKDTRTVSDRRGEDVSGQNSDQEFVNATKRLGNVIHTIEVNDTADSIPDASLQSEYAKSVLGPDIEEHRSVKFPFPELAQASRMIGHSFVVLDADGPVRREIPFVRQGKSVYPSVAVAAAMLALDVPPSDVRMEPDGLHFAGRVIPLLDVQQEYVQKIHTRHILIPYKASAYTDDRRVTTSYRSYRFWDLFLSELQIRDGRSPTVNPADFKGKIVFVGTTAAGLHDLLQTPYGEQGKMPGMQIHANVVDGILSDSFIRRASRASVLLLPIVSTTAVAFCGVFTGFWWSLLAMTAIVLSDSAIMGWSFRHGIWLQSIPAALGIVFAQFSSVAYKYFVEDRAKREVHALFSRYVPPMVVRELVKNPSMARLGGQRREMSVLFSDIRGFTTLSEAGKPEDVIAQLNEYFTHMVDILFQHHGTLDKFVGDMIMALFNAPVEDPDHADHAVQMGLAMLKGLAQLNAKWATEGKVGFDIGVGINTGEMIVGNVGSEKTLSYTVIGDNVNLGSRLESLNKEYNTHVIISEATCKKLKGSYNIKPLGSVKVKGKTREVAIFSVE